MQLRSGEANRCDRAVQGPEAHWIEAHDHESALRNENAIGFAHQGMGVLADLQCVGKDQEVGALRFNGKTGWRADELGLVFHREVSGLGRKK